MTISNPTPVVEKAWRPNKRQESFIQLPDSIFEALYGGAAFGGKSELLVMLDIVRGFIEYPKFKSLYLRRTFADLEKEIIPRSMEWYKPMGATYNETKKRWTWPSGAISQFGHAERESDVRDYDSAEYNLIKWDESTHFTEFQYEYLSFSRCRSSSSDLPAIVRSGTNPGNISHDYFRKRFVDPARGGMKILKDARTGQKRIFVQSFATDNPVGMKNDPTYVMRLEMLPEAEKRAKLYGDWYSYFGQVFTEWRIQPLANEPANAQHLIEPFSIPSWWPRIIAIDWGYAAMTVALWGAVSPEGICYLYRVYSVTQTNIKDWSTEIVNLSQDEDIRDVVICHSAQQNRGEPLTIRDQVHNAFTDSGFDTGVRLGERDRIGGKLLVHEYLRWNQKNKVKPPNMLYDHELASKILRLRGETAYKEYLTYFIEEEPETNLPKLRVFTHSPEGIKTDILVDCINKCVYEEVGKDGKKPEDVREFSGDDPYDALRMLVRAVHRFTSEVNTEFQERQKIDSLYADLAKTGNQSGFYRNLEKLEESKSGLSVRGHRRIRSLGIPR